MKWKILIWCVVVFGSVIIAFYYLHAYESRNGTNGEFASMPSFRFRNLSGKFFTEKYIPQGYNRIIIAGLSTSCDHCEYMTHKIVDNEMKLQNVYIVLIFVSAYNSTLKFVAENKLRTMKNLIVLIDSDNSFQEKFSNIPTPVFFIYDGKRTFIRKITGETSVDNLLK